MNFLVTVPTQLVNLCDDVGCGAALLSATRVRHDAISAELVAAFDDGNERHVLRRALASRYVPNFALGTFVQVNHATLAVERPRD
jgi:hypothetical protein